VDLSAETIKGILAATYQQNGHAVFLEFRTVNGFINPRYIDVIAVGLYSKNSGIKAFEVKVSRNDFMADVSAFTHKHRDALEISTEFYYVCPWGLVGKDEVPSITGLIYVDSANQLKTVKKATLHVKESIPFYNFQAFAKQFGNKVEVKQPIRFMGKDISSEDLDEEIKRRLAARSDWELRKIREEVEVEVQKKESKAQAALLKIKHAAGLWEGLTDESIEKIISACKAGTAAHRLPDLVRHHIKSEQAFLKEITGEIPEKD